MSRGWEQDKANEEAKARNQAARQAVRAAVRKYADGERTREDVMRMSGAGKALLMKMEQEYSLKFGKAR